MANKSSGAKLCFLLTISIIVSEKQMNLRKKHEERIKTSGIYCKAVVISFANLNVFVNKSNQMVGIEVRAIPDNKPAFTATVKAVIKEKSIPSIQAGEEIFVRFDLNDKTRVAIEHS